MTLFRRPRPPREEGALGRGEGRAAICLGPARGRRLPGTARSQPLGSHLPARPAAINAPSVAAPRYKGAAVRGSPGWGVSSPGEGLPPRGRPAGDRGARGSSPAPRSWLSPGGELPTAAHQAFPLRPGARGRQRVCGAWAPERSAGLGGGPRALHLKGPARVWGRPGAKTRSCPPLPMPPRVPFADPRRPAGP